MSVLIVWHFKLQSYNEQRGPVALKSIQLQIGGRNYNSSACEKNTFLQSQKCNLKLTWCLGFSAIISTLIKLEKEDEAQHHIWHLHLKAAAVIQQHAVAEEVQITDTDYISYISVVCRNYNPSWITEPNLFFFF